MAKRLEVRDVTDGFDGEGTGALFRAMCPRRLAVRNVMCLTDGYTQMSAKEVGILVP